MPLPLRPAAALAALLGLMTPAAAADDRQWMVQGDDSVPYITFDTVGGSDNSFALICDNGKREAAVTAGMAKGAKRGQPVTIALSSGEIRLALKGLVATDNGTYGHARRVPYRSVIVLLEASGPVKLEVGKRASVLGDSGRGEKLKEFMDLCKLK